MKDKLDLVFKRESILATMQCTITELKREIEQYKEENKYSFKYFVIFMFFKFTIIINLFINCCYFNYFYFLIFRALESENNSLNVMIDAFKESIKTKDELIFKFCDNSDVNFIQPTPIQLKKNISSVSEGVLYLNILFIIVSEVPEAIMFDFTNTETDVDLKKVLAETSVNDVNEMKDLVDGYSNQNKFLNNEVIG